VSTRIAIDFDETLVEGAPPRLKAGAVDALVAAKKAGHHLILHSCRSTVTGHMQLDSAPGIDIPASALTRSGEKTAVWVVDPKSSTVSARSVQVRAHNAAYVQIGSGLAPGDVVVTAGVQALRPGQQVRMLKAQP